jgi:LuxR family maltose regulon positive regulatory protein
VIPCLGGRIPTGQGICALPARRAVRPRGFRGEGQPVAGTVLAEALLLGCPQGYVRVFADEGPPMAALLGRLIAARRAGRAVAGVPLGYLTRLQRAFGPGRPGPDPVPAGIIDPLTSRELEVLKMLAAGRSNQAIARKLVVILDTVKKQAGHVWASSARPTASRPSPRPAS